ncbi:hypothetical protein [Tunturiibacter gelidoferens]|uniref:Uncharacterized protein n=1 Tax=Tunturiibacter gelidiferens TaxID=3069689 RepID=A0ACC5P4S0_9BACT|nr:hypothetical protein [Edaphobacter lichenicola]MBB5341843.1 hypothetical protein [Edaphobacter lichenicola]
MTSEDLALLKSSIDLVVTLETVEGERFLAQILFVFEGEETPDVFYLKVEPGPHGNFVAIGNGGHSTLLSDIASVRRLES